MPQRDFSASTSATPTAGSRYMISRDQTLWEIAALARPEGASIHQTMLDIQRLNPDAFIGGNINRVKAGYIVYLPSAEDISSADLATALAEVNEQNAAWREGRDTDVAASSGPALKISAEPVETAEDTDDGAGLDMGEPEAALAGTGASPVDAELAEEGADSDARLAAMQRQLETLQRIVSVKDEQIAALQSELAGSDATEQDMLDAELAGSDAVEEDMLASELAAELGDIVADEDAEADSAMQEVDEPLADVMLGDADEVVAEEAVAEAEPAPVAKPAATTAPADQAEASGGFMQYIWYILGAAVLAAVAFVFSRRRGEQAEDDVVPVAASESVEDAFTDVKLQDEPLDVTSPEAEDASSSLMDEDSRGYGQRKHDEYASDVEAADALAEADIYIAYGRQPQAIELLTNALANEPGNPVYRLKLVEIHAELGDRGAATAQLEQLQKSGDADSIARAEALIAGIGKAEVEEAPELEVEIEPVPAPPEADGPGLAPNPLELISDSEESLEADFSDLEIEGIDENDELDLSADFEESAEDDFDDDEELVIADDANGLSTKMDLARAYLDMGDDDGARQILDEVVAEGSEELKAEALELLDRIG